MPRTFLAVAVCAAGLVAGCGSGNGKKHTTQSRPSAKTTTTTTSSGPAMATTGPAGSVGPAAKARYNATNQSVLYHIKVALVRFFTSKGFSGVTTSCKGVTPGTASCDITGTNRSNQTSSAVLTLSVNQTNGVLRITRVS